MRSAAVKSLSAPVKSAFAALIFVLAAGAFAPEASALPGIDRAARRAGRAEPAEGALGLRTLSLLVAAGLRLGSRLWRLGPRLWLWRLGPWLWLGRRLATPLLVRQEDFESFEPRNSLAAHFFVQLLPPA